MSGTYKAIGINLKSSPLGESDRLLTILTEEYGLLRATAPGSRKHNSSLGGRSSLFVINQLLIARGRNLDKIIQAETVESFPKLSQDLSKLTAAQYLAELTLFQALSDQPQTELFHLLRQHLSQLEQLPQAAILPYLAHAAFHLLAVAGLAPQVRICCLTQQPIVPDLADPDWRIGFSMAAGGTVFLAEAEAQASPSTADRAGSRRDRTTIPELMQLTATELGALQQIAQRDLSLEQSLGEPELSPVWLSIERVLRHYAQYHFDRPIRSAALIDTCFADALPLVTSL